MKNVRWYGAFMLLSIMFFGGCGGGSSSDFVGPTPPFPYENGEYITVQPKAHFFVEGLGELMNNTFNSALVSSFKQGLIRWFEDDGTFRYGWDWEWPSVDPQNAVLSYPSVNLGHKPGYKHSTDNRFPKKISDLNEFKVSYELEVIVEEGAYYNTNAEIWLVKDGISSVGNIKSEIMIWSDYYWHGYSIDGIDRSNFTEINGHLYDIVYVPEFSNYWGQVTHSLIIFKRVDKTNVVDLNFKEFLDFCLANGYIDSDWYISNIEMGNEVSSGKGRTKINNYSVVIN